MKRIVCELANYCTVGIISGRDLEDVRSMVGLDNIIFAGSHGYDVYVPGSDKLTLQKGLEFLPMLEKATQMLEQQVERIENCRVERKKFSIAVHYRKVRNDQVDIVEKAVDLVHSHFDRLRKSGGKKIFELQPDIEWDKGRALLWLVEKLGINDDLSTLFYIGDDVTDEDAFKVLESKGVSILVAEDGKQRTCAKYILKDTLQVKRFLEKILQALKGSDDG